MPFSAIPAAQLASTSNSLNGNVLHRHKKAARRSEKRRISEEGLGVWTQVEHARFLEGKRLYPTGPWKLVAEYVGTRNTRQTMTHAQKFRQKLERRQRGLRTTRKVSDDEQTRSPEAFYASSPRMGRASAAADSPKGVDMALSTVEIVDVAPQNANATVSGSFGSFEQLLLDNTISTVDADASDASHSSEQTWSYMLELPVMNKHAAEAGSPTHHADADLPWLDDCLDFIIHNLP